MKKLDILIGAVLIIGGLNWGMIGLFDVNLVSAIFGAETFLSRVIYILVGFAAVYDIVTIKAIWKRWNIHMTTASHA